MIVVNRNNLVGIFGISLRIFIILVIGIYVWCRFICLLISVFMLWLDDMCVMIMVVVIDNKSDGICVIRLLLIDNRIYVWVVLFVDMLC